MSKRHFCSCLLWPRLNVLDDRQDWSRTMIFSLTECKCHSKWKNSSCWQQQRDHKLTRLQSEASAWKCFRFLDSSWQNSGKSWSCRLVGNRSSIINLRAHVMFKICSQMSVMSTAPPKQSCLESCFTPPVTRSLQRQRLTWRNLSAGGTQVLN